MIAIKARNKTQRLFNFVPTNDVEVNPILEKPFLITKGEPHLVQTRRPARERSARKVTLPHLIHGL